MSELNQDDDDDFFEDDDDLADDEYDDDGEDGPNVRAPSYFIVESRFDCLECDNEIPVYAFGLPADHQLLVQSGNDGELEEWRQQNVTVTLSNAAETPEPVGRHVSAITTTFRLSAENESDDPCWTNFCPHCGSEQDELDLHDEVNSPFGEDPYYGLDRIRLWKINEPFEAWGQVSSDFQNTPLIPG